METWDGKEWIFQGWLYNPTTEEKIKYLEEQIAYAKTHFPTRVRVLQKQLNKLVPKTQH